MRIIKVPSGEYYLQKGRDDKGFGCFWWMARADKGKNGAIYLGNKSLVPKELIGKKLMFKVEVKDDKIIR